MWIAVLGSVKLFPNLEVALKGVFNRVVTTLYLRWNKIGDEGAKAIAEALKVNAAVTTLYLGSNNIGDEGAIAIAEALKVNAVLKNLRKASASCTKFTGNVEERKVRIPIASFQTFAHAQVVQALELMSKRARTGCSRNPKQVRATRTPS